MLESRTKVAIQRHGYGVYNATRQGIGEDDFIFKFVVVKDKQGRYRLDGDGAASSGKEKEMMAMLWARIRGI